MALVDTNISILATWILLLAIQITQTDAIGCYVCSSTNGSDPRCEDEFNAYPEAYQESCFAARKGRTGLFPATWCIKFKAYKGNMTIVVRNCALDNGGLTKDVEIGTLDHCGWTREIKYNGTDMKGCLMVCDIDGCNSSTKLSPSLTMLSTWILLLIGLLSISY